MILSAYILFLVAISCLGQGLLCVQSLWASDMALLFLVKYCLAILDITIGNIGLVWQGLLIGDMRIFVVYTCLLVLIFGTANRYDFEIYAFVLDSGVLWDKVGVSVVLGCSVGFCEL